MIWILVWKVVLVGALILFAGVSIVVIIGGLKEIITLLNEDK
tara:strand:- start:227 stop:352 length:126 start_codon:yes stop_codon:yes gene_type:complete